MATNTTVERILDGTLRALARHGHRKLSMSDICEHAGVSRGTLYRYFNSKEEVLEAVGRHVEDDLRERLTAAIADRPEPENRLRLVGEVIIESIWRRPETAQMLEVEPGFVLDFVRNSFPAYLKMFADALKPAAPHVPAVRDGRLTIKQLAELTLRIGASAAFVPGPDVKDIPKRLEQLAGASTAKTARTRRRPAAASRAG